MPRIGITVSMETKQALEAMAKREGRELSNLVRLIIMRFLEEGEES